MNDTIEKYDEIIKLINLRAGIDLRKDDRSQKYVCARAIYYDLAYNHFRLGSMKNVTDHIGRHHTTALHSIKRIIPDLPIYFPEFARIRYNVLETLSMGDDFLPSNSNHKRLTSLVSLLRSNLISVRGKYDELKEKQRYYEGSDVDRLKHITAMISELPDDKLPILEERLKPIIYMLCRSQYSKI